VVTGGQSIVPPNQAGAGVFNCPDDYLVVNGVRLCGEKLNDATRNIDFTVNAPVTGNHKVRSLNTHNILYVF
jgi:hypothetical protein